MVGRTGDPYIVFFLVHLHSFLCFIHIIQINWQTGEEIQCEEGHQKKDVGFRVWGAGNNQPEMSTENLFKISLTDFAGAINKKTGHYKEGGDLIEIRFFHSQVHKGFRVWILDPLIKALVEMLIKTPVLGNMVIVSMHTEEEKTKKEDNNSTAPRISFFPPLKKP